MSIQIKLCPLAPPCGFRWNGDCNYSLTTKKSKYKAESVLISICCSFDNYSFRFFLFINNLSCAFPYVCKYKMLVKCVNISFIQKIHTKKYSKTNTNLKSGSLQLFLPGSSQVHSPVWAGLSWLSSLSDFSSSKRIKVISEAKLSILFPKLYRWDWSTAIKEKRHKHAKFCISNVLVYSLSSVCCSSCMVLSSTWNCFFRNSNCMWQSESQ